MYAGKSRFFLDKEQKEMEEEEEIDKLMLHSLCSEITDEVMSLENAYPNDCGKLPSNKTSFSSKKTKQRESKLKRYSK
jgi:hypothetical protein